jgi:hypothetical protein
LRIVFIAEPNRIIPATTNAAPASKLKPELESFIETHTKMPRVMAPAEINISRACARRIRTRGGFNGTGICWIQHVLCTLWLYNANGVIRIRLVRHFLTPVSRGIDTVFTHRPSAGVPNRGLHRFRFTVSSLSLTETRKSANRPTNLALLRHA